MTKTIKCYNDKRTVTYTADGHGYYVHELDKSMPGVTTIIQKTVIKEGIPNWMLNVNNEYTLKQLRDGRTDWEEILMEAKREHLRIRDQAGERGTMVHKHIEAWVKDHMAPPPQDPQALKAWQAFCGWYNQHDVRLIASEEIVYHDDLAYCGTLDIRAIVDGELSLVDNKTSSGFWREMPLQLGGYALAIEKMTGERYDHGWVNILDKKTGLPTPHYVPLHQVKALWPHCIRWYRALQVLEDTTREIINATKEGRRAWSKSTIFTHLAEHTLEPTQTSQTTLKLS